MKLRFPLATLAGVLTWLLVALLTLLILLRMPGEQPVIAVSLLLLVYGVSFTLLTQDNQPFSLTGPYGRYLLWLPLFCAFSLLVLLPPRQFDYLSILSIIWVCLLPHVMSQAKALLVSALVVASWFILQAYLEQRSLWIMASLYGAFHLFAVVNQSAITAEQQAKQALAEKNLELQSAQQLLLAASKQTERTRIARNLHDLLGHHLTALTIQLQIASYQTEGDAKQQVDKSLQLARLLLSDVREAVTVLREDTDLNLQLLLQPLLDALPEALTVELDIPAKLQLSSILQAQHLLMVVREAMSNTLKHAGATQLSISARISSGQLMLTISDNGKVTKHWQKGNGLTGIQERLAECGGTLDVAIVEGAMQLQLTLPQELPNV